MYNTTIDFIRSLYSSDEFIPLHEPRFVGNELQYVQDCIESTFVSSVGKFVDDFEDRMRALTGSNHAIATSNGTAGLHIALYALDVGPEDLVLTQPLTFVATCNAITYTGAQPVFVDVDKDTLGMSPASLEEFLEQECESIGQTCIHKATGKVIKACVPMHTFGLPCRIEDVVAICDKWHIWVIEDAAESLGSYVNGKHTGTFGKLGVFSFNGNKIVTAGGGGCVVTNDEELGRRLKHLTTTAKVPHSWAYNHDEVGFNYRMPNLNAALVCAQLEMLPMFIERKRELNLQYQEFFKTQGIDIVIEIEGARSNYWLNTILLPSKESRDMFLSETNDNGVMTRPAWDLMCSLPMFSDSIKSALDTSLFLADRIINIPSSVIIN